MTTRAGGLIIAGLGLLVATGLFGWYLGSGYGAEVGYTRGRQDAYVRVIRLFQETADSKTLSLPALENARLMGMWQASVAIDPSRELSDGGE